MPTDKKNTAGKKVTAKSKASTAKPAAKKKPAATPKKPTVAKPAAKTKAKPKAKAKGKASASGHKSTGAMTDASAAIASYVSSMKESLKEWGIEIDTLRAKADKTSAGMRKEINHQIKALSAKEREASTRLQHLLEATGPAWRDFAKGIERAVHDLKVSLEKGSKGKKSK